MSKFVLALTLMAGAAFAAPYTPAPGTSERRQILDAVRTQVAEELGGPVEFVVSALQVEDGWAFMVLNPQRPGGRQISISETVYARYAEVMDGLTTYALARRTQRGWERVEVLVGPTDAPFVVWDREYGAPAAIFSY